MWGQTSFPRKGRCMRKATVDGKWCKQHSPEAIAERTVKSKAKNEANLRTWKFRNRGQHYFQTLKQIAEGCNDPQHIAREAIKDMDDA